MKIVRVLFVCMGNICRSPTAEGVMRHFLEKAGMQDRVMVDSAGTHDYHSGAPPDLRAQMAARRRGYDLSMLRARQIVHSDFERFDSLLAMDFDNLELLQTACPEQYRGKLGLLMQYARRSNAAIVHDPYYRDDKDFDLVLDHIEDACLGLIQSLSVDRAESN